MKETVITYQNRVYKISPGAAIAAEIEDEIAPIPDLAARFANGKWCVQFERRTFSGTMDVRAMTLNSKEQGPAHVFQLGTFEAK